MSAHDVIAAVIDEGDPRVLGDWMEMGDIADAVLRALTAAGYSVVPSEPTVAMIDAGNDAYSADRDMPDILIAAIKAGES